MMDPSASPLIPAVFSQLSPVTQAAINAATGKLIASLVAKPGRRLRTAALGDSEQRAIESALRSAVGSVLSAHEELEAVGIDRYIANPPVSHFITEVLANPLVEIDQDALRTAIDEAGLDFDPIGIDPTELVYSIRRELLQQLRSREDTRQLYGLVRLEEAIARIESLDRKVSEARDLSVRPMAAVPAVPQWTSESLSGLLRRAREELRDGRLDKAEMLLRTQLDEVQRVRRTAAGTSTADDPDRRRHEQEILLALAQLAVRRNQQRAALDLVRQSEAPGPIEGRNRYFAGWVCLNVGQAEQARDLLTPSDGSPEWRDALAVAYLMVGDAEAFRKLIADPGDVDNPDVILALVRHHAEAAELAMAEHFARRLSREADSGPIGLARAIEAASALVTNFAWADAPGQIEISRWIDCLREWFPRARADLGEGHAFLRREALWHEVNTHLVLLEGGRATDAWHELSRFAPSDAAQFAALAPIEVDREGLEGILGAARDPVIEALLHARLSIRRGDFGAAAERLRQLPLADSHPRRDHVTAMRLELQVEAGEDVETALAEVSSISDPVSRALLESSLYASAGDADRALAAAAASLKEWPHNLRALRAAYFLAAEVAPRSDTRDREYAGQLAVDLAMRLIERLPCPEHRIMKARALARIDRAEEALTELRAIDASGYVTAEALRLTAHLATQLRYVTELAAATRRLYEDFDHSDDVGLEAARAAFFAGEYESARELLYRVRRSQNQGVALAAWSMLALVAEASADNAVAGRNAGAAVLIEAYDALGGPIELAGAMFMRAVDTPLAKEAAKRIERDHGSLGALPGVTAFSIEEAVEMIRKDEEAAKLRIDYLAAGLLPFDRFAEISPRNASYLWFAHRIARLPQLIAPPHVLLSVRDKAISTPPRLLLDRTALLLLAEVGLADTILSSQMDLLLEQRDFDWIAEEEVEARSQYRAGEHEQLRRLLAFIDRGTTVSIAEIDGSDETFREMIARAGGGIRGLELALAQRDNLVLLDDFVKPDAAEAASIEILRSPDLLHALVPEPISYAEAERAREAAPRTLGGSRREAPVTLHRPILADSTTLRSWHDAGLLERLAESIPKLVVSPATYQDLRERFAQQEAYSQAVDALCSLRSSITAAVESDRMRLVRGPDDPEPGAGSSDASGKSAETRTVGRDAGFGEKEMRVARWLTDPLVRRYSAASDVGAAVWSDDAATHLYLSPLGPLVPGVNIAQRHSAVLQATYPDVDVYGTSDVLRWLEGQGLLDRSHRLDVLADLARQGRMFLADEDLIEREAQRLAGTDDATAAETLRALSYGPPNLRTNAAPRFVPSLIGAIASSIGSLVSREDLSPQGRRCAIMALVDVLAAWLLRTGPNQRLLVRNFWKMVALHIAAKPNDTTKEALRCILGDGTSAEAARLFRLGVTGAFEQLLELTEQNVTPMLIVAAGLQALTEAIEDLEVDGRALIPLDLLQIALPLGGLELNVDQVGEAILDGESVSVRLIGKESEREAARLVDMGASNRKEEKEIEAAYWMPVSLEAEVIDSDRKVRVSTRVPIPRLLHRVGPGARGALLVALGRYYAARNHPELAAAVERLKPSFQAATGEGLEQVRRKFNLAVLRSPRTWASVDFYEFFLSMRETDLRGLRAMVGAPPRWRIGENFETYLTRVDEESGRIERSTWTRAAWGPFGAPVGRLNRLMADLTTPSLQELRVLALQALRDPDPYTRIFSLAAFLELLARGAEFQSAALLDTDPSESKDQPNDSKLADVARVLLLQRLQSPSEGRDHSKAPATPTLRNALDEFAARHAVLDQIHALVSRVVYRQVLSHEHDLEAVAEQNQEDSELDPLGDMLLVAHLLVPQAHDLVISTGREFDVILSELREIQTQVPLSAARFPVAEQMQPEQLGMYKGQIDPYLTTFLALLEASLDSKSGVHDEQGLALQASRPFWWSTEIEAALRRVAQIEEVGIRVAGSATGAGYVDRFHVLFSREPKERAQSILRRVGSWVPEGE